MVSTKELETCMEFYEKNLFDHQESMQKMLETVQISIESLTVAIAAMNAGKKIMNDEDHHSETPETVLSIVDRVHIPFLSFDGSNFRDWKAKAEQFFELEGTPKEQRRRLLLLSMDGKAFAWQRHYM